MTTENQAPEGAEWSGAVAFIQHAQNAAGSAGADGHWPDEFLRWYKPEDWAGEHRAAAVFMGSKIAALAAQPASSGVSDTAPGFSSGVKAPAEGDVPGFDECVASGQSCSYGPHGPKGEMQCCYCGKEQQSKGAAQTGWHFARLQPSGTVTATAPDGRLFVVPKGRMDSTAGDELLNAMTADLTKPKVQPKGKAPDLYERLAEAHDACLDDDHRACRAILTECMSLLASQSPAPAHELTESREYKHAMGDWLGAVGELIEAMGRPKFAADTPVAVIAEAIREAAKRLAAASPAVGAQPEEVQHAAWRTWADAGTVGSLIAFLATLDHAAPIVSAYHVTMGSGERRCKTHSLTISRERVDHATKTIRTADTSLPYTHVLWAQPPEPAGLPLAQEPKYTVNGHAIVNRASGVEIPADEPVFILRASDKRAASIIGEYAEMCNDPVHAQIVSDRFCEFGDWADAHPERMKEPDTASHVPVQGTEGA